MKSLINVSVVSRTLAVLAASLFLFSSVQAQEVKIGVVSTERIFREGVPYKAAQTKIELEFSKRQKELQDMASRLKAAAAKMDKEAAVLSDSDRIKRQRDLADMDRELQRTQREFREDLNQRRNEEMASVIEKTNKVIKQIAVAEHYDIILQEAVYISPRVDITDKVLKALTK